MRKEVTGALDIHKRLSTLLQERGWTEYRLSRACGLSQSTIGNIFRRQTVPSLSTLEAICRGFGMTLGQFFAEGNVTEVTGSTKELLDAWMPLTPEQKKAVLQLVQVMNQKDGASSSID